MKQGSIKSALNYYGGKARLAPKIISLFPSKILTYVEPFCGAAHVFFRKAPSELEILNDRNKTLMKFYNVVRTNCSALKEKLEGTLFHEGSHRKAVFILANHEEFSDLEIAWAVFVGCNQSMRGIMGGSWLIDRNPRRLGGSCQISFYNRIERLNNVFVTRLKSALIYCRDALNIVDNFKKEADTLYYCDPPYIGANMGHYKGYTQESFNALLDGLEKINGRFLLSSFLNTELTKRTHKNGWYYIELEVTNTSSIYKKKVTEVITANYPIEKATLFQ